MRKLTLTTLIASAALAAGATPADADSIAYVKDGSVWLSTPDGTRQYQVTNGGGYSAVSQSDDGHLAALHGDKIAYLDQQGNVIADIKTPVSSGDDPTRQFKGPFDPVISPDGKRIAYTYYWQYIGEDPYCNPSTGCYTKRLYQGIAYTHPTRLTAWDEPGMRRQSGWIHPFWVGNDRTFHTDPSMSPNEDMIMNEPDKVAEAEGFTRWFSHPTAKWWKDSDMTRSQKKLAGVVGEQSEKIWFAYVQGLPVHGGATNYPTQCSYEINGPTGKFEQVSWSPDGKILSYSDGAGINVVPIPEFGATYGDCGTPKDDTKLLIAGGASPSYGPANVPPARQFPPTNGGGGGQNGGGGQMGGGQNGGGQAGGGPNGGQTGGGNTGGTPEPTTPTGIVVGGKPGATLKLGSVLKKGLSVSVPVPQPGSLTVTIKAKGKTVATGKSSAKSVGSKSLKLTFTKSARTTLGKSKSVTFTVNSSLKPKGGGKVVRQSTKVTIGR